MKDIGARVIKNTSAKLLNQAILFVSSFAITIPLARVWGAEAFGRYSFVIASAEMFTFAFDWGLNWLLTREVARDKENVSKYLSNALSLTLLFSIVTLLLLGGGIMILDYPREVTFAMWLAGLWVSLEVLSLLFINGTFYAFEKMEYETPPLLAEKAFVVALGLVVIVTDSGLLALLMVLVASRVIKLCTCAFVYLRKIGPLSLGFDYQFWRVLARSAFPFGLNLAFGLIYTKIDITMLSLLTGDEAEIGFYRAALALVMYLPLLALALTTSLFPIMSELYVTKRKAFVSNYQKAIQSLFSLGLPMTIGICLLADRFVVLFYGAEFEPTVIALRILSLAVLLKFIHGALAMVLTASDRQSIRTGVVAFAALGNVILNLFLIPWRGYIGASVAAVLTDGLILAVFYVLVMRQIGHLSLMATVARALLSGLLMGLCVFVFHQLPLLILVPLAASIYIVVLYALGGLPTEDFTRFRKMLLAGRFR